MMNYMIVTEDNLNNYPIIQKSFTEVIYYP